MYEMEEINFSLQTLLSKKVDWCRVSWARRKLENIGNENAQDGRN